MEKSCLTCANEFCRKTQIEHVNYEESELEDAYCAYYEESYKNQNTGLDKLIKEWELESLSERTRNIILTAITKGVVHSYFDDSLQESVIVNQLVKFLEDNKGSFYHMWQYGHYELFIIFEESVTMV
jgi:hypothetical protein